MVNSARSYIPSLYFMEGLPYAIVNMMSVVLLKNLGFENTVIGFYTSILYIPWTIKVLWAPAIDLFSSRRQWILVTQILLGTLTLLLSVAVLCLHGLSIYFVLFLLIAFISATQDIAIDGYYMDILTERDQAFYVGVRNAFYKLACLFGSGTMVYLAGYWAQTGTNHREEAAKGWSVSFVICAVIFFTAALWHMLVLPKSTQEILTSDEAKAQIRVKEKSNQDLIAAFRQLQEVFFSFLQQERIMIIILYILTFRLGDALMLKMAQPFLLDPTIKGGLNVSTAQLGLIYGTVGMIFLLIGGLLGGWLISKYSLKKCLLPTAIVQNSAILLYWVLAIFKPDLLTIACLNALEQLAYGLGTAAYTVFLLTIVKKEYKASHYALATALMALGLVLPGSVSGYLADHMGYQNFFLLSFFLSLPGIICILYLPLNSAGAVKVVQ